ncbi:MAG: ABC transporter substrate-binding protein [Actinobacteria bacterium]|nr:ABC transporter substrate-binding protein [Actinomycetota bacterium]
MRKLIACGVALVAALALTVPGALGGAEQTPGVTAKKIVIGGTFPLTGPVAAYAPIPAGMAAYFSYINARRGPDGKRGVMGRQIVWKYYDDGYNPANTVQLTRKLVEEDKVFATVGQLGTEHNLAVRSYLNQSKVPQTLVSTGASYWGTQYAEFPWTIGWQPDYIAEGRIYGLHIKANFNGKKIAVLYQNDDYGKDYLLGVRAALGKAYSDSNIVAQEAFEATAPNVTSQMAKIKASGATIFVILATPLSTIRAYGTGKALGWNPEQVYVNSVSATAAFFNIAVASAGAPYVNGSLSVNYLKDPSSPTWTNDAAMKQYRTIMAKYAPNVNANNGLYFYGVAKAETFVQALYKAGKSPTRVGLMNALLSLNQNNKFALPGVTQKTTKKDHFIISQMQLQRYTHPDWKLQGKLIEGRPR